MKQKRKQTPIGEIPKEWEVVREKKNWLTRVKKLNPLLENWTKFDILFFFVLIPTFLTAIYLLSIEIKNSFRLFPSNPTILSIFISNYTHTELSHFKSSVLGYWFIVFILFNLETKKRLFYRISTLLFILLPFLSSLAVIYLVPRLSNVQGFSAILSGFLGYLLYAVYNYIKKTPNVSIKGEFLSLLIILNLSLVGIFNLNTSLIVKSVLGIVSLAFLYINFKNIKQISIYYIKRFYEIFPKNPLLVIYRASVFILASFFVFSLPGLIPLVILKGTALINTLAHYVGYCFGVTMPIVIEKISRFHQITKSILWKVPKWQRQS